MNHIPHFHTGLIIGRFQPFHLGHLYLFQETLKKVDKVIVGIGSVNIHDDNNPFTQTEVELMLSSVLAHEKWTDRIIQTFCIPDIHDDKKWLSYIVHHSKPF